MWQYIIKYYPLMTPEDAELGLSDEIKEKIDARRIEAEEEMNTFGRDGWEADISLRHQDFDVEMIVVYKRYQV